MSAPQLYHRYDVDQAIALFGDVDEATMLCGDQWIMLPKAILCLATVGQPPEVSHFNPASRFRWVCDRPYKVVKNDDFAFLPKEVRSGRKDSHPIYLFVRTNDAERFMYVGQLTPYMRGKILGQGVGFAEFDLAPTLPSRVWKKLGGPRSGNVDTFALDKALHGVKKKQSVHDRLATLRRLAEHWHGPLQPGDGFTEDEVKDKPIPYPLRWWYQLAGHRTNIMSGQNFLQEPDRLELDKEGRVAFYYENQCCYQWGTTLESDDPPVLGREDKSDPWTPEGMVLSQFLIEACMCEAIIHAPYAASAAWIDSDVLATIAARIPALPLAPWRWPGATKFYAANGAFMLAMPNGEYGGKKGYSVWIGAKTEHPLAFLKPIVDDKNWEYISL